VQATNATQLINSANGQPEACPVKHEVRRAGWFSWISSDKPTTAAVETEAPKCPVDHSKRKGWWSHGSGPDANNNQLNPLNNMPDLSSQKAAGQTLDLPTERTMSTIPRGVQEDEGVWEYPSPQQMFNAMLRKGGGEIPEDAVESMVDIHNFLNEGAWQEILQWEAPYTAETKKEPRLLKFTGRPDQESPRAQMLQLLGKIYPSKYGTPPPFDRHDWTVLRGTADGSWYEVRYVIDYYAAEDDDEGSPAFVLDVRPALDSFGAARDRIMRVAGPAWDKALGRD
jgi:cytochrome c heme-lyase